MTVDRDGEFRTVGLGGTDETIQGAHDALGDRWSDRGRVGVLPSYDPAAEEFPIRWTKVATLFGGNSRIVNSDDATHTLVVDVDAPVNRPPGPRFENFNVVGGDHGILKRGGRYTMFRDVTVEETASDGYHIADEQSYGEKIYAPNTHRFFGCVAEECGRHGWYVGDGINGVSLLSSNAYYNGGNGVQWNQNYAGRIDGGSFEQNGGNGVRLERVQTFGMSNSYVEHNGTGASESALTAGVFVSDLSRGVSISDTYFHGLGHVSWGVRTRGRRVSIEDCYSRGHTDGFVCVDDPAEDTDWHRSSHLLADGEAFGVDGGTRTRDDGTIVPQDLRDVTGQYDGDAGLHVTADGRVVPRHWYGGEWCPPS